MTMMTGWQWLSQWSRDTKLHFCETQKKMIFNYISKNKTPNATYIHRPTQHSCLTKQNKQKYTRYGSLYTTKSSSTDRHVLWSTEQNKIAEVCWFAELLCLEGDKSPAWRRPARMLAISQSYAQGQRAQGQAGHVGNTVCNRDMSVTKTMMIPFLPTYSPQSSTCRNKNEFCTKQSSELLHPISDWLTLLKILAA